MVAGQGYGLKGGCAAGCTQSATHRGIEKQPGKACHCQGDSAGQAMDFPLRMEPGSHCSLLLGLLPQQNKPPETQKPTSSLLSTLLDLGFLGMHISSSRLNCHMQSALFSK